MYCVSGLPRDDFVAWRRRWNRWWLLDTATSNTSTSDWIWWQDQSNMMWNDIICIKHCNRLLISLSHKHTLPMKGGFTRIYYSSILVIHLQELLELIIVQLSIVLPAFNWIIDGNLCRHNWCNGCSLYYQNVFTVSEPSFDIRFSERIFVIYISYMFGDKNYDKTPHNNHPIARSRGCLLWVQRLTYDLHYLQCFMQCIWLTIMTSQIYVMAWP